MTRLSTIALFLTVMSIAFIDALPTLGLGAISVAALGYIVVRRVL